MKKRVKKIFFHVDTFLLVLVFVWIWFTISLTVDQHAEYDELTSTAGRIESIDWLITGNKNKLFYKDTTCAIHIKLQGRSEVYKTGAKCSNEDLIDKITVGDSINVFTHEPWLGYFGMGSSTAIKHLIKGREVLIDHSQKKSSQRHLNLLTGAAAIIFLIWYINRVNYRLYWD